MKLADRINALPPYLFVEINRKIEEKKKQGIDIVTFAIGDPDMPTPDHIIDELCKEARNPVNHKYPETAGLPVLCDAIAEWYKQRFNISLSPEKEVLPLIGSKEGIGHISFCFIDKGDVALVTNPGYPVYAISTMLAGGETYYLDLKEENNYLPDFNAIPGDIKKRAKILWLNYPNNPTGAVASIDFFNDAVRFARNNDILICHDAPYTEVAFDGYVPPSFLQAEGAGDVAIEFHSLSKTYNMTGWRIGMAVGNETAVNALFRIKSNLDSGIPQAIQYAAIDALLGEQKSIADRNKIYQRRRDVLVEALNDIGLKVMVPKASFYIWAKVPEGYTSVEFTTSLLDKANVAVTPGTGYGSAGEGYVRLSITLSDERLNEGIRRLRSWNG
jgi:LL-diaminopimelate aminotransferase